MPSILATALQNTCLKAGANLTAQLATRWHAEAPEPLDLQRILEFAIFGFVGANIGYVWHHVLEDAFPTRAHQQPKLAPLSAAVTPHDGKCGSGKGKDFDDRLEKAKSGRPVDASAPAGVSWRNVAAKVVADQTLGLGTMLTIFLFITNVGRLATLAAVADVIHRKLWGLIKAGWTIWPAVGVCNFLWVPVRSRVIVASCVGFGWNIFLSVMASRHAQEHVSAAASLGKGN